MSEYSLAQIGVDAEAKADNAGAEVEVQAGELVAHSDDHFIERNGLRYAGSHLIIDLWNAEFLDDVDVVELALRRAIKAGRGATLLHLHLHEFASSGGVSGVAVLARCHRGSGRGRVRVLEDQHVLQAGVLLQQHAARSPSAGASADGRPPRTTPSDEAAQLLRNGDPAGVERMLQDRHDAVGSAAPHMKTSIAAYARSGQVWIEIWDFASTATPETPPLGVAELAALRCPAGLRCYSPATHVAAFVHPP